MNRRPENNGPLLERVVLNIANGILPSIGEAAPQTFCSKVIGVVAFDEYVKQQPTDIDPPIDLYAHKNGRSLTLDPDETDRALNPAARIYLRPTESDFGYKIWERVLKDPHFGALLQVSKHGASLLLRTADTIFPESVDLFAEKMGTFINQGKKREEEFRKEIVSLLPSERQTMSECYEIFDYASNEELAGIPFPEFFAPIRLTQMLALTHKILVYRSTAGCKEFKRFTPLDALEIQKRFELAVITRAVSGVSPSE